MSERPGDWHPEDIKAAIRKRGLTLAALAERLGTHAPIVSRAMYGPVSELVERGIADFLEVHPSVIWPTRFTADGASISFRAPMRRKVAA